MISFDDFYQALADTRLENRLQEFRQAIDLRYTNRYHGDHEKWMNALNALPDIQSDFVQLDADQVGASADPTPQEPVLAELETALRQLHPWRKGPFDLFGIKIDTEWRSDWKWQRIAPHLSPLENRTVLDVGCGSGYHCWRMAGAGARLVIGIDPSPKLLFQFKAIKKYLGAQPVYYLPLRSEDFPASTRAFDTVFSLGVLYHRRSPFQHLEELKQACRPGGELVLETLTIEGGEHQVLLPEDRYAQMRNVWFLPSEAEMERWLHRAGFSNIRLVDTNVTSTDEQRSTDWMQFHSLAQFLDPANPSLTIEGYPAPQRSTFIANAPG